MIWVDVAIVVIVILSAVIGFFRGFLREVVGLATWVFAFYLAFRFSPPLGEQLQGWIDSDSVRLGVAFAIIFLAVLIVGAIFNHLIGRLVIGTGLAGTDRVLGIVFGTARGIAVLIILVLLAGVTSIPRDAWWQNSIFTGQLEAGALWVRDYLPENIASAISYPDKRPVRPVQPKTETVTKSS